ncbi:dse1p [Saccharomyces arboricola H-6]|uniref:Protein DSE1 n=1 Tax=Saccharomyces arboricola (strain H-6 / AS 2.3317 / CBS 10644) TaxID=1160507 RepID=J8PPE3_SACAR|nr:dse1p [Saccharomyces arboricola H-6]
MQDTKYYEPINIFRQPAINIKKRPDRKKILQSMTAISTYKKSWQNNTSKMNSPILRKASDNFNDFYTTKKLKSDYWKLYGTEKAELFIPSDISLVDNILLVSAMNDKDNLKLFEISNGKKLKELQTITVPGKPITCICLLPMVDFPPHIFPTSQINPSHNQLILTGHQDGIVNLISTSTSKGCAKIIKRFNHNKFLRSTVSSSTPILDISPKTAPILKVSPWNKTGFVSLLNDSLFIYDLKLDATSMKTPIFLQSFPGINSFSVNQFYDPFLLALVGSQFGPNGISLLDLRTNLYIPDILDNNRSGIIENSRLQKKNTSLDCVWIDNHHVAQSLNDKIQIWDIQSCDGKPVCELYAKKGYIERLKYNKKTSTIYSSDDQGFVISWDLQNLQNMKYGGLIHGFNSINSDDMSEPKQVFQCGNIMVSGVDNKKVCLKNNEPALKGIGCGFLFLDMTNDGSLVTLDNFCELGLHQVCQVQCNVNTGKPADVDDNTKNEISDSPTLLSSNDSDHSITDNSDDMFSNSGNWDCSSANTISDGRLHSDQEDVVLTKRIYSMNDMHLSGSTIDTTVV